MAVGRLWRRIRVERSAGDLNELQYSVLALLVREGPRTSTQVAEFERVSAPSVTRTAERLVALRLAERRGDPGDARVVRLAATRAGVSFVHDVRRVRSQWLCESLARLSEEERQVLARAVPILRRLVDVRDSREDADAMRPGGAR